MYERYMRTRTPLSRLRPSNPSALGIFFGLLAGLSLSTPPPSALARGKAGGAAEKPAPKVDIKSLKCQDDPVRFLPREVKLACKDEYRDCDADIPLVAKNCSKEFLEFVGTLHCGFCERKRLALGTKIKGKEKYNDFKY